MVRRLSDSGGWPRPQRCGPARPGPDPPAGGPHRPTSVVSLGGVPSYRYVHSADEKNRGVGRRWLPMDLHGAIKATEDLVHHGIVDNPLSSIPRPQLIGVSLAVAGNIVISVALSITKYSHNINAMRREPLPYTELPMWWVGLGLTVFGEVGNFIAYGFAGASVIAPLGAVAVLANAFIAAIWCAHFSHVC
jgi:hypothetical protein